MQSCLGIAITNKIIKYAKVEKDKNNSFKVSCPGIRFYDELELSSTIDQIINETDSKNIPISINVRNEKYYYFDVFSLTNKEYVEQAIETEFESYCSQSKFNPKDYSGRSTYTKDINNSDRNKVIYSYVKNDELENEFKAFNGTRLSSAVPMPFAITNIIKNEKGKNVMIVDLDDKTTITTIINQQVYNVDEISIGLSETIDRINTKENSYLKTYEVLKNTTIYTSEANQSEITNSEYLQFIVPALFKICQEIQDVTKIYTRIDKIYLTGIGTVINNIDLYFQEYFKNSRVEILKPFFLEKSEDHKIDLKDYIEVNPAIALAIQGLGYGLQNLNFKKSDGLANFKKLLNMDLSQVLKSKPKISKPKLSKLNFNIKKPNLNIKFDLSGGFDKQEIALLRDCIIIFFVIIIFCIGSILTSRQISHNKQKVNEVIQDTQQQITLAGADESKIKIKTDEYNEKTSNLKSISSKIETSRNKKNQVVNLLLKIVDQIPKEVTLTSIDQTGEDDDHIVIKAQSKKYEQLAYFKAKLKNAGTLDNVISKNENKSGDVVSMTIEGDLKTY